MSKLNAQARAMLEAIRSGIDDLIADGYEYDGGYRAGMNQAYIQAEQAAIAVPEPVPFKVRCEECGGNGRADYGRKPCPRCHGKGRLNVVEVEDGRV